MLLVEAAGFDTVIVETVGVGQSETAVADMVDMFIVLLLPGGGDDLQGIKRGVIELADLIVVNKADGDLKAAAQRSAADYQHALRMLRSPTAGWTPEVATCSALTGDGVVEIWDVVERFNEAVGDAGHRPPPRRAGPRLDVERGRRDPADRAAPASRGEAAGGRAGARGRDRRDRLLPPRPGVC